MAIPKSKVDAFPRGAVSLGEMVRVPLKYHTVLRLMLIGSQMPRKESPLQGAKVEGAAYAENSSVIEQPIL